MRIASPALAVCLLVIGTTYLAAAPEKVADKPKDLIVGKWMTVNEKEGGTLEFTKDGKVTVKIMQEGKPVEIKGTYRFTKDDTMETELEFRGEKRKDTLKVTIAKDEMTTVDSKGTKDSYKRVK